VNVVRFVRPIALPSRSTTYCLGFAPFGAAHLSVTPPASTFVAFNDRGARKRFTAAANTPAPTMREIYRSSSLNRSFACDLPAISCVPVNVDDMKRLLCATAVAVATLTAPAAASAAEFEGTVVSVNRDARIFRLHDSERGTVTIRVTSRTRFERVSFRSLRAGLKNIEATVRRSNGRWVASEVERSGGGGHHGGDDD
jgi:shikimate kinase